MRNAAVTPDSKGSGAIPFAICDTACWNVLGIRILIIRVCLKLADFRDLRFRKIDFRISQRIGDVHQEVLGERREIGRAHV